MQEMYNLPALVLQIPEMLILQWYKSTIFIMIMIFSELNLLKTVLSLQGMLTENGDKLAITRLFFE